MYRGTHDKGRKFPLHLWCTHTLPYKSNTDKTKLLLSLILAIIWKYLNCSFDYFYSQTETFRICTGSSSLILSVNQTYISCATFYGCAATGLPQDTTPSCHLLLLELVAASLNTTYWEALQLLPVLIVCTPFACHKKIQYSSVYSPR